MLVKALGRLVWVKFLYFKLSTGRASPTQIVECLGYVTYHVCVYLFLFGSA